MLDQRSWDNSDISEFTKFASHLRSFMEEVVENKNVVRILKSLHFKQIKERHSDIPDAHQNTFEWIFNPFSGVNFMAWLSSLQHIKRHLLGHWKGRVREVNPDEVHSKTP